LKVVCITGGARGIGLSIARIFAKNEFSVIIADKNTKQGKIAAAKLCENGLSVKFYSVDLIKKNASSKLLRKILCDYGRIDILINNARAGQRCGLFEETEKNWDVALAVDLKAAFFTAQSSIKYLSKNKGSIINIGSIAAIRATNESPSYHAAKGALLQLTKYLAFAAGPLGVRVNCVLPGFIVQEQHQKKFKSAENKKYKKLTEVYQPLGFTGTENDVAEAVYFLASEKAQYISGASLILDGAASCQEPWSLISKLIIK